MSKKSNPFSPEVRERAVRMVREHRSEYPSLWTAIESIAPKIGCKNSILNCRHIPNKALTSSIQIDRLTAYMISVKQTVRLSDDASRSDP